MNISEKLTLLLKEALNKEGFYPEKISVTNSKQTDFQYSGLFQIAKENNLDISNLAERISEHLKQDNLEILTHKGFININVLPRYVEKNFRHIDLQKIKYTKKILVDFGGPNTAKSLHVGHLRSLVIGESIRKLNEIMGNYTDSDIHIGDFGFQMGMLVYAVKNDPSYEITAENLENTYKEYSIKVKENLELRKLIKKQTTLLQKGKDVKVFKKIKKVSIENQLKDISKLNVNFTHFLGESDSLPYFKEVLDLLSSNNLLELDNKAYIVKFEDMAPLVLMNSEGSYLYAMTDLATLLMRKKANYEKIIYVTDSRQELHFKQIFNIANKLNLGIELNHVGFGTVNDIHGKPFKTRDGETVKLSNLLEETHEIMKSNNPDLEDNVINKMVVASLKFADLSVEANKNYTFDPNKFTQLEGKTGNYILYTVARINSILNKVNMEDIEHLRRINISSEEEKNVYLVLDNKQKVFEKAIEDNAPNMITDYIYNLSNSFNKMYSKHNILSNPNLINLSKYVKDNLTLGLSCLSIEPVEKMSYKKEIGNKISM
jgi:arginyl-tRNA synthetase